MKMAKVMSISALIHLWLMLTAGGQLLPAMTRARLS